MALVRITDATEEPVSVSEAKEHLRIVIDQQDALIARKIKAARQHCELFCERAFVTQTWRYSLDDFPGYGLGAWNDRQLLFQIDQQPGIGQWGGYVRGQRRIDEIIVPMPRLIAVTSLVYKDVNGVSQTLSASAYEVNVDEEPAVIVPAGTTSWPTTDHSRGNVKLTYAAGYGAAASVPEAIGEAILKTLAHSYENRGEQLVAGANGVALTPEVSEILTPYRLMEYV